MSNQESQSAYDIPGGVECPRCKNVIQFGSGVTPGATNEFRKGLVLVCGHCALITMVGDSKLIPMSKKQVMAMPKMFQAQLAAVCMRIAKEATKAN